MSKKNDNNPLIIAMNPLEWTDEDYNKFFEGIEEKFGKFQGTKPRNDKRPIEPESDEA